MKRLFVLLLLLIPAITHSQTLKKYPISDSGCSAYFFCDPLTFQLSYSDDSSKVYTGECKANDSLSYGIICVKLKTKIEPGQQAEDLLIAYLDYLKKAFEVEKSAGYGKGHTLSSRPAARGIIDYWQDKLGEEWKIKGWADGNFIAVLYVYAKGKMNETTKVNVFLDSFRFPVL